MSQVTAATTARPSSPSLLSISLDEADRLAKRLRRLEGKITVLAQRLRASQNARLGSSGLFFLALVLLAIKPGLRLEVPIVLIFLVTFSFLVVRTRRMSRHLGRLRRLYSFYERQEKRCRGLISGRAWEAAEKAALTLEAPGGLGHDLGLLGAHSLWTLIDETLTDGGALRLLEWMHQRPLRAEDLRERQSLVQSLRGEGWFFTRLTLEAEADEFRLSSSQILKFIKKPFVDSGFLALWIFNLVIWFAAVGFTILGFSRGWSSPGFIMAIFSVVSLGSLMRGGSPFLRGVGLSHHLGQLAPIFEAIETRAGRSLKLQTLCPVMHASGPSREARKLNRVLAFMSVQANPLVHLAVNAFLPWSITATHFLERRRKKIAYTFPQCLEELSEMEALASLVIFDRHQTDVYPSVEPMSRRPRLAVKAVFHPLIDRSRVVANDFEFSHGKSLGLLTGSNMSGKSTFLRTIGMNQALANLGAPVFAETFETCPMTIETCIEVSDSLRDGFSYFYAEVRRLKSLLAEAATGEPVLFLVDEIFRGTNNRERQIGSRAVIRTLANQPSALGFISTHDLELTSLEATHPTVMNLHFREDISPEGKMLFSYHLRHGPCPTTNALIIMKAEGIDVDEA